MRTELPEKWYIEVTEENSEIVNTWRKSVAITHKNDDVKVGRCILSKHLHDGSFYFGGSGFIEESDYKNYQEITFEEFQRLVLNKSNEIDIVLW